MMKQRGDIKVAAGPSDNRILVQPPLFRPSVRLGIPPRGIVHASAGCRREVAGNAWGFVLSQVLGVQGLNDTRIDTQFACESVDCVG